MIKVCADGGVRVLVNGQISIHNFNSPPLPPVGYGPTPGLSAKFSEPPGPRELDKLPSGWGGFWATPMEVGVREAGKEVC